VKPARVSTVRDLWVVLLIFLLGLGLYALGLLLLSPGRLERGVARWLPVPLHSVVGADYGKDEISLVVPPIQMSLMDQAIHDQAAPTRLPIFETQGESAVIPETPSLTVTHTATHTLTPTQKTATTTLTLTLLVGSPTPSQTIAPTVTPQETATLSGISPTPTTPYYPPPPTETRAPTHTERPPSPTPKPPTPTPHPYP
jgi:hypothetical protein